MSAGVLDADTIAAARQLLRDRGLFTLTLTAAGENRPAAKTAQIGLFKQRVTKPEIMLLTSQLVIMCRAGVDLAEALQNVTVNCKNPTLKSALDQVYQDVGQGLSFSASMKKQVHIFGEAYVASVAAGEASGKVPDVLARLADVLNDEIKLNTTIKSAISYPVVLIIVCLVVITALLLFVLPNFKQVFRDMGVDPPATTQLLLDVSSEFRSRFWLWGGIGLVAVTVMYNLCFMQSIRRFVDNAALKMVLLGAVLQSLVAGRLFVMLGTMLQSGVSLIQSLQLCRAAMRSICYQELLDKMQDEVLNGRGISRVLSDASFVPPGIAQMVGTAERSGKLGTVMQLVGEYYEAEGQRKIQELAKLLEPAIVIVMGIIVAFVVSSVMLPILDISSSAGK